MIEASVFDKRLLSLTSSAFLGYYFRHDLTKIVESLTNGVDITTDPSKWNLDTTGYTEILKMWQLSSLKFVKKRMFPLLLVSE
jgi:hypothetical protein